MVNGEWLSGVWLNIPKFKCGNALSITATNFLLTENHQLFTI
ncbi:hypothetical protein HDC91_002372 [Mucilaginibacter sp. AK015]|nr:hypothetical protein [Mucilaginibacter sp. AK015]